MTPATPAPEPRLVVVRRHLLKENDLRARGLRRRFADAGLRVISLVSSPGSGKTALLEALLTRLHAAGLAPAALVGDLATDNDAQRLARSGALVRQINTGTVCHLDARMIDDAIAGWSLRSLHVLFIENVGNLVCPSAFVLGEHQRWVLTSVTEGEDKPLKYPTIFDTADLAVITKLDLAPAVGCDLDRLRANIRAAREAMPIVESSARSSLGLDRLIAAVGLPSSPSAPPAA